MKKDKAIKYFNLAKSVADFSKDETKVGCIIIAEESLHVLSMGYNGMPRLIDESIGERWERPLKYKYVVHAEANAVAQAARSGNPLNKSIAVVTMFPCSDCAKLLIQAGVREVITTSFKEDSSWIEHFNVSKILFEEANVAVTIL